MKKIPRNSVSIKTFFLNFFVSKNGVVFYSWGFGTGINVVIVIHLSTQLFV
jgi:hypothetical protein